MKVLEDHNNPVGLLPRFLQQAHASTKVLSVIPLKVVSLQKKEHSAAALVANRKSLAGIGGLRQEQARYLGLAVARKDDESENPISTSSGTGAFRIKSSWT